MRKNTYKFIKNHNLANRTYEMLKYFDEINYKDKKTAITNISKNLFLPDFVESLATLFEEKYKHYKKVEIRCNLKELIDDLNILKQYLED